MRQAIATLFAFLALAVPCLAQNHLRVDDLSHHPFSVDFPSGGSLDLYIRSADVHIVGSDEDKLAVHIRGGDGSESTDIDARFDRSGHSADLHVFGGPHNDVTITVELPRRCDLFVRIPAGDVDVNGITGNKNIFLRAGDLRIDVGNPADYAHVEASVTSGDIEARPFGESHGGLFRSFEKSGPGQYTLVARLWAGDIVLK